MLLSASLKSGGERLITSLMPWRASCDTLLRTVRHNLSTMMPLWCAAGWTASMSPAPVSLTPGNRHDRRYHDEFATAEAHTCSWGTKEALRAGKALSSLAQRPSRGHRHSEPNQGLCWVARCGVIATIPKFPKILKSPQLTGIFAFGRTNKRYQKMGCRRLHIGVVASSLVSSNAWTSRTHLSPGTGYRAGLVGLNRRRAGGSIPIC